MKTLIFHLLLFGSAMSADFTELALPSFAPPAPGQRITAELSTDLQTWERVMRYNSPRGFIRARTDSNEQFALWINGADALIGEDVNIFANGVRNIQCWGASLDLTAFCTTNKAGVLVSPRHVLFVTHWHPDVGATLQWVTNDNQTVTRTLAAITSLPNTDSFHPDITVGLLDDAVPTGVSFAEVFGNASELDWNGYRVPVVIKDQFNTLHEADVHQIFAPSMSPAVWLQVPASTVRLSRFKNIVAGDSGSPVCLVSGDKIVLLTLLSQSGAGRGTFLAAYIAQINAAMQQLGGGYQLTTTP